MGFMGPHNQEGRTWLRNKMSKSRQDSFSVGLIALCCEHHLCPDLLLVAPSGSGPGLRREGPFSAPAKNPCEGPGWVMAPSVGQSLSRPALEDGPSFVAQEWGAPMTAEGRSAPSVC